MEVCVCFGMWQDGYDFVVMYGDGMVFQYYCMWFDWNDMIGFDEQVVGFGEVWVIVYVGLLVVGW